MTEETNPKEHIVKNDEDTNGTARSGNTKLRSRAWCFTWNNYSEENEELIKHVFFDSRYVVGREVGAQGTRHLQGFVQFKNPRSFNAIKAMLGDKPHIEKCRNVKASIKYCQKDGDFFSKGIDVERDIRKEIIDSEYKDVIFKDWQQRIINIINEPADKRTIYYVVDYQGNNGKTWLSRYLCCKYDNILYVSGKSNDVLFGVSQIECPKAIIFDIPRSTNDYISYGSIEKCKDGLFFSSKYESKMVIYPYCHVFLFMNQEPDLDKLSQDRWVRIITIGNPPWENEIIIDEED